MIASFSNVTLDILRGLRKASDVASTSLERLSSGLRINHASDDPAGLALSTLLESEARLYSTAVDNINSGISLVNSAQNALSELSNILAHQRELAEQACSSVLSDSQRTALQEESDSLIDEYNRIVASTEYNDFSLLVEPIEFALAAGKDGSGFVFELAENLQQTLPTGVFQLASSTAVSGLPLSITNGDFNNDNRADLVTVSGNDQVSVLLGGGDNSLASPVTFAIPTAFADQAFVSDLDQDGNDDLIATSLNPQKLFIFWGNGNGTFSASQSLQAENNGVSVGYLDADDDLDIIASSGLSLTVLLSNGNRTFGRELYSTSSANEASIALADLDGDGDLDAISTSWSSDCVGVSFGNGNGTFSRIGQQLAGAYGDTDELRVEDLDGDGELDIVSINAAGGGPSIFIGNGNGTFRASRSYNVGSVSSIEVGDVNGDSHADIVAAGSGVFSILLGDGSGGFSLGSSVTVGINSATEVQLVDLNGDSILDLGVSHSSSGRVYAYSAVTTRDAALPYLDLRTVAAAEESVTKIEAASDRVASETAAAAAMQSRCAFVVSYLGNMRERMAAARNVIVEVDVATETATLLNSQIVQQGAAAMLAHANLLPETVLRLLDGGM